MFLDDIIIIVCSNLDMDCKFDHDIFAFEPGKLIPSNVCQLYKHRSGVRVNSETEGEDMFEWYI